MSSDSSTRFDFGERLGIFIMVESASLSAIAVSGLLLYISFRSLKRYRRCRLAQKQLTEQWINMWQMMVIQKTVDYVDDAADSSFFICLMFAELVQAIGGLLNIRWIIDATITEGPLCTAQAVFKQFGDVGVAFMSLCIAFQTFSVLVLRWQAPPWTSKYIIGVIFLAIALMQGIGAATHLHEDKPYYGDTGLWCWVRNEYRQERIALEYLWLWVAEFLMFIINGFIFLVMRQILVVGDETGKDRRWKLEWNWKNRTRDPRTFANHTINSNEKEEHRRARAVANLMLFYPAVYIFCVFPMGLVRWLDFGGHYIPTAATVFASIVFSLSGLLNTILYTITRPELVRGRHNTSTDVASGNTNEHLPIVRGDTGHLPDLGDDSTDDQGSLRSDVGPRLWRRYSQSDQMHVRQMRQSHLEIPQTQNNSASRRASSSNPSFSSIDR